MNRTIVVGLLTASMTLSFCAFAAKKGREASRGTEHPVAVEVNVGPLGSPWGVVGGTIEYLVLERLALVAGVGTGKNKDNGIRYGGGLRVLHDTRQGWKLGGGVTYTVGDYHQTCIPFDGSCHHRLRFRGSTWVNADAQFAFRTGDRYILRSYIGVSKLVSYNEVTDFMPEGVTSTNPSVDTYPWLPYVGQTFGVVF